MLTCTEWTVLARTTILFLQYDSLLMALKVQIRRQQRMMTMPDDAYEELLILRTIITESPPQVGTCGFLTSNEPKYCILHHKESR